MTHQAASCRSSSLSSAGLCIVLSAGPSSGPDGRIFAARTHGQLANTSDTERGVDHEIQELIIWALQHIYIRIYKGVCETLTSVVLSSEAPSLQSFSSLFFSAVCATVSKARYTLSIVSLALSCTRWKDKEKGGHKESRTFKERK